MKAYYEDPERKIILFHGDCREILPEISREFTLISDPPYGINLETDYSRFRAGEFAPSRVWDAPVTGDAEPFDPTHLLTFRRVALFGANYFSDKLPVGKWILWNKRDAREKPLVISDAEMCWHNGPGRTVEVINWFWIGFYRKGEKDHEVLHPTQKPLGVMRTIVERLTEPGEWIVDPYAGSGTTLLAAQQTGRPAIGIEIEERLCQTIASRLSLDPAPLFTP